MTDSFLSRLLLLIPISIVALFLAGSVLVGGSENSPWVAKDPHLWTLQDAEQVLWKSPWVRTSRSRFFTSRLRIRQITCYVRIQSAQPIRMAMATAHLMQPDRFVIRAGTVDSEAMLKLSEEFRVPDELVVALIAWPGFVHGQLDNHTYESLTEATYLQLDSGERLRLKGFVPPSETTFGEAWFRFARPELGPDSGKVKFVTRLEKPHSIDVKVAFDPSKLGFDGEVAY